jgi:hypothetical protein
MIGWKDAIEIAKWSWDNRAGVKPVLAKFQRWWRKSKILIIGPGGTGKSTLARMLSGEFDWLLDSPWRYDESLGVDRLKLKADPAAEIVVMPGQRHRRRTSWSGIGQELSNGTYHGVIFVMSYGYHSLSHDSYKQDPLYEPDRDRNIFLKKYLDVARQDEIACLQQLVPFIKECPRKIWLTSLVTKQDLWRNSEIEMEKWYCEGAYGKLVEEIASHRTDKFCHEFHPVSLVIGNFSTVKNEMLAKNLEGYDHRAQIESIRRLFEIIDALRKWGNQR